MTDHFFLPNQSGTYCLVCYCSTSSKITIGKLGKYKINPGYYCYIGSAFGQGGLKSRVKRHLRIDKRYHWHFDYLRQSLIPVEIWYSTDKIKREHQWANLVLEDKLSTIPIKKFGSSDCDCISHLFYYERKPKFQNFVNNIIKNIPDHDVVKNEIINHKESLNFLNTIIKSRSKL